MAMGKNYPYNIQETLGAQTKLHTQNVSNQKSRTTPFLNCTSTKLESRIRISFIPEMLQGIIVCRQDDVS